MKSAFVRNIYIKSASIKSVYIQSTCIKTLARGRNLISWNYDRGLTNNLYKFVVLDIRLLSKFGILISFVLYL